jgi:hypothetical protein
MLHHQRQESRGQKSRKTKGQESHEEILKKENRVALKRRCVVFFCLCFTAPYVTLPLLCFALRHQAAPHLTFA